MNNGQKDKVSTIHISTKKAISRRTVLKGTGAALALPMLDAMTPAFAQSPAPVHRFQTVYICLLYTSPSPRDLSTSRMPSSA